MKAPSGSQTARLVAGAGFWYAVPEMYGENGLTFRALATRLETGHGAIQWHVANKSELLKAATAVAVARAVEEADPDAPPREAIHAVALGVFDAMDAHPWIGGQLARPPWQSTMLQIFENIGRQVRALGAPATAQFTSTSALLHYIIGAGGQNATNSRSLAALGDRQHVLDTEAALWKDSTPGSTRSLAPWPGNCGCMTIAPSSSPESTSSWPA
jgi:AcrR family transcriptional regulator